MVRFPAVAHFNFLDFPENFKNCFRLHRKRRNPGCSLAVEYLWYFRVPLMVLQSSPNGTSEFLYIYMCIYIYIYIYIYICTH